MIMQTATEVSHRTRTNLTLDSSDSHTVFVLSESKAHVAGSIVGRRSDDGRNERSGDGDGVAKAAKLAFFDIGPSNDGLRVPLISTVFATGYKDAGARIHSASWGSPRQNSYSSYDHSADSFM